MGFRVYGLGFGLWGLGCRGFRAQGCGCRGCRDQGVGCRGLSVQGFGYLLPSEEGTPENIQGQLLERQSQNPALTVLIVPTSLDSGFEVLGKRYRGWLGR